MREIVLDTETTGLDPKKGDRLIEVGCIEIFNRIPTGREFHRFINPERDVPIEAQNIHGISTEFLAGKPLFCEVARDFLAFIGDDTLVIHNAQFDVMFLNHELGLVGEKPLSFDRVVDALADPGRRRAWRHLLRYGRGVRALHERGAPGGGGRSVPRQGRHRLQVRLQCVAGRARLRCDPGVK